MKCSDCKRETKESKEQIPQDDYDYHASITDCVLCGDCYKKWSEE